MNGAKGKIKGGKKIKVKLKKRENKKGEKRTPYTTKRRKRQKGRIGGVK